MKFSLQQVADILEGTVVGDPSIQVDKLSKIEEGTMGSLSFLSNSKYTPFIYSTQASAVIVDESFVAEKKVTTALIKVSDARAAFTKLLEFYQLAKLNKIGVENPSYSHKNLIHGDGLYLGAFSYVSAGVVLGENVKIYPQVFIGENVSIGNNVHIFSGVKIMSDTVIGDDVMINPGSVIGADGFGYLPNEDGSYSKIPQTGNVIIEDDVNIGALTTIDRATLGSTVIKKGAKLDNQIQIAHNVEIGNNTVIAAQTGIAGSTKVGQNCRIGGQVGIAGHLAIGNQVGIQAQSGVGKNLREKSYVQGSPAFDYATYNRSWVHVKNLSNIEKRITKLEKKTQE
ncbi:MAG: UDP-3-O-(3-hydroxymyristoyl)glucosamine N-acyltransferase [Nonlabens sp.]